jgi:hypothetical protein
VNRRNFTKQENTQIKAMIRKGMLYHEIAKHLDRPRGSIAVQCRKLGLSSQKNYFKRKGGYYHRIEEIYDLYKTRTAAEVAEETGLKTSQVRSALLRAIKVNPSRYKTKDKRRRDTWSAEELITLLQYSGLQERGWIAKKLNRGTHHAVKEVMSRMSSSTRYINGLPLMLAEQLIGETLDSVKTSAGAPGSRGNCRPKLVPWVVMAAVIKKRKLSLKPTVIAGIEAMASFQMEVHGCKSLYETAFRVASLATEV